MCEGLGFSLSECLGRRLEGTRNCRIVDGLSATSRRGRGEREIAERDALEMSELAVLA